MKHTALRPWIFAAIGLYTVIIGAIIAWPSQPLPEWPSNRIAWNMYASVHGVCAQVHNSGIAGQQLPLCARNTGIYGALTLSFAAVILAGHGRRSHFPPLWQLIALLLPVLVMAVDGFNSLFVDLGWQPLYQPQNWLRTLTGAFAGISAAPLFIPVFNKVLCAVCDKRPIIAHPLWIPALWGIAALFAWATHSDLAWVYWPVAITSWLGIIGILLISNTFAVAVALGYDHSVSRLWQLARPLIFGTLITSAELAAMAWLRFGFESNGWM